MSPQLEPLLITYHMMMMVVNLVNKMIGVEILLLNLVSQMMWGDLSSSVLISILRQSTPLFQLWQLCCMRVLQFSCRGRVTG